MAARSQASLRRRLRSSQEAQQRQALLVRKLQAKAEQSVAELTGAQRQLSAEMANLHVATANMSSITEALALDKVQLNKLMLQLEKRMLFCRVKQTRWREQGSRTRRGILKK